jgi:hypothetical protein
VQANVVWTTNQGPPLTCQVRATGHWNRSNSAERAWQSSTGRSRTPVQREAIYHPSTNQDHDEVESQNVAPGGTASVPVAAGLSTSNRKSRIQGWSGSLRKATSSSQPLWLQTRRHCPQDRKTFPSLSKGEVRALLEIADRWGEHCRERHRAWTGEMHSTHRPRSSQECQALLRVAVRFGIRFGPSGIPRAEDSV